MNPPEAVPAAHAPPDQFDIADDCLQVGGLALPDLAARVGRTPFYAYERRALERRAADLRARLPAGLELHYAVKANPMPALVQHMVGLVDGLDVASAGELTLALNAGADPASISFAGPGKRAAELRQAVAAGIVINLESGRELAAVAELGRALDRTARVAVRVNPAFALKASGMKMGGGPAPFGVDEECVPALLARIGELAPAVEFVGFHIYAGSQTLNPQALVDAHRLTLELALRLAGAAPAPVRLLNIGGGFGIPYFPGERRLDIGPVCEALARQLPALRRQLPQARPVLELGRYLVGEAGIYVTAVIERKVSRGETFLIVDGGLHQHLAASGNFGQVLRKNYPLAIGTRLRGGERETVNVVGPLCTPLDVLGRRVELARAGPGDLLVVFQSGAYGLSASPVAFLAHPPPAEILL